MKSKIIFCLIVLINIVLCFKFLSLLFLPEALLLSIAVFRCIEKDEED